jgi:hypothetical protein
MVIESAIIRNRNSVAEMVTEDIFFIHYLPDSHSNINDFKEGFESFKTLTKVKPVKVLVEMGTNASLDKEAREHAQVNKLPVIAEALVLHYLPQRIIFNFYLKYRHQDHPLKIFKDKTTALIWLGTI